MVGEKRRAEGWARHSPLLAALLGFGHFKVRHSHRRRWAMRSMPGLPILKYALAATPTRPLPSTSCGDLKKLHQSMNWSAVCDAGIAHGFKGDRTSAAI
jgi:hypothetical protein